MPTKDQARQLLVQLIAKYRQAEKDKTDLSEADVVQKFIEPLLETVLGWEIQNPNRYRKELYTQAGRPDITLIPEQTGVIFVEAKKFGKIAQLQHARKTIVGTLTPGQMALPGMTVDRTAEEQQAINYAFENGGTWAILTNFEKLRLFNARRDWLVLSFETPGDYLESFDWLWQLAYENVIGGSLDRLSNQRHTEEVDKNYLAFINEWREKLARDVVTNTVTNTWILTADASINLPLLRGVVQRFLDRLVIIRFAEDHLVIPPGTLYSLFELAKTHYYTFTMDEFVDRFFRRFDEQHNSALFAPGVVDEAHFSDAVLQPLVQKLYEARYRAMPADILGNTYEQYLGKTLVLDNGTVSTRDNLETRKKQGSYYTPQVIVRYIVDNSLGRYLYGTANGKPDGDPLPDETRKTSRDIRQLRVLDSACGSGSFLIYAYYVLADFYQAEIDRLDRTITETIAREAVAGKDRIDIEIAIAGDRAEKDRIRDYATLILEQHLYGTDLDPQAAEIAVVNLMMRAMERQSHKKRLPLILNQNVKVGNALIGVRPDDPQMAQHAPQLAELIRLRRRLLDDPDKPLPGQWEKLRQEKLAQREQTAMTIEEQINLRHQFTTQEVLELKEIYPTYYEVWEKTLALSEELSADFAAQFSDLERVRPFHWGVEFPEVFYDEQGNVLDNPGFTIVFGNPPWEILKPDLREFYAQFDERIESKLTRKQAEQRIEELEKEDPRRTEIYAKQTQSITETAAWVRQANDYTRQGKGDTATHKLFLERMYTLLAQQGRLGYVVPSGIYTDLGTKDLREMLLNEGNIQYLYSFSNERYFFPGVHHSFKFVLLGAQKGQQTDGFWASFRFNPRVAISPDELPAFLAEKNNQVYMRRESLTRFSPDSLSVMEFQSQHDYEVIEKTYGQHPLISENFSNNWNIKLNREFDFANDRQLLNQLGSGYPFYEGKMIHQFDAFYAQPQFWIAETKIATLPEDKQKQLKTYRIAHRRIARPTDERTIIAAIVPPNTACENNATTILVEPDNASSKLYLCSLLNSLVLDSIIRYKIAATLNMFYLYQLPMPRLTAGNPYFDALVPRAARLTCTRPEFAALWQEVMPSPLEGNVMGEVDPIKRQQLRDEIDAIVAHLYGLSRADFDHILRTFPLVFPDTPAGHAKREHLLEVYDDWAAKTKNWL